MHILAHYVDILIRKGPADNYHMGIGEGLHPQTKRDYSRGSRQPSSVENEVVLILTGNICLAYTS